MDKVMIKSIFVRIKSPQFFLALIFLGLGFVVLALSVKGYKEFSQREINVTEVSAGQDPDLSAQELQAMFGISRESSGQEFEVVVEKNLFSQNREAWQPPPPKDDQEEESTSGPRRVNPGDFKLYGITTSQDEKMALVHYERLPEDSRNRLVAEGETVYYERDGGEEIFRVASIEANSVTLEAQGESFEVGLFGHDRENTQTQDQNRMNVVIGGTSKPVNTSSQEGVVQPASSDADSGSGKEPSGKKTPDSPEKDGTADDPQEQSQPGGLPELLKKLRQGAGQGEDQPETQQGQQDMEAQVQEGNMRRIDTPFGPIYRPVD